MAAVTSVSVLQYDFRNFRDLISGILWSYMQNSLGLTEVFRCAYWEYRSSRNCWKVLAGAPVC